MLHKLAHTYTHSTNMWCKHKIEGDCTQDSYCPKQLCCLQDTERLKGGGGFECIEYLQQRLATGINQRKLLSECRSISPPTHK